MKDEFVCLENINEAYGLDNSKLSKIIEDMDEEKISVPFIGKFSSGKSALINALLAYSNKILKEDITPETAIPTEIVYTEHESETPVEIVYNDGKTERLNFIQYRSQEFNVERVQCVRLSLRNQFMSEIKDVMLVDMPGFESGYDVHNKAIDNYLPNSLAYIVAFQEDDMILRSTMANTLRELHLNEMPVSVVITKMDKCNSESLMEDFEKRKNCLEANLKKCLGDTDLKWCLTSSKDGEIDELKKFLRDIQCQSKEILKNKFKRVFESHAAVTEKYLNSLVNNDSLSQSELSEKEDELLRQTEKINQDCNNISKDFDEKMVTCIEGIKNDVINSLQRHEDKFTIMIMNKNDINAEVNMVIRSTITESVNTRLVPIIEMYIQKVSENINIDTVTAMGSMINIDCGDIDKSITAGVVKGVIACVLLSSPILGGIIGGIYTKYINSMNSKKREQAECEIKNQLNTQVFPNIMKQVECNLDREIMNQLVEVKSKIEEQISSQREAVKKALRDLKGQQIRENDKREKMMCNIHEDLKRIGDMKNEF